MKKMSLSLLLAATVFTGAANASLIGISDSGTDFEHVLLSGKAWVNTQEIDGNLVDDDGNGKVDDINGWNFAEDSGTLFVRDHLLDVNPITYTLLKVIAKMQSGELTEEDKKFWNDNVASLNEQEKARLLNHLNFYGQYAHGTHVAGISAAQSPDSKILVGRMFPDEPVYRYKHPRSVGDQVGIMGIIDYLYGMLAKLTSAAFNTAGDYLHAQKVDVANYSLGVGLKMIAQQSLALRGNKSPTDDELSKETHRLFKQYEVNARGWIDSAKDTLFVIAAGNDGTNNDKFPIYPGSVRAENAITVAASHGNFALAEFSNFGPETVDIAAPGVAIESAVPVPDRTMTLPMSGTSMAAPYVTGVAAYLKSINPELTPAEIKLILMKTVDAKPWLRKKVISQGVVNSVRAARAAELSTQMELSEAINTAYERIGDIPENPPAPSKVIAPKELKDFARQFVF